MEFFAKRVDPKAVSFCVPQLQTARLLEEFLSLGLEPGHPLFNVVNTELIEFLGNEHLVIDREGDGFALRAVPECGIECVNALGV